MCFDRPAHMPLFYSVALSMGALSCALSVPFVRIRTIYGLIVKVKKNGLNVKDGMNIANVVKSLQ